MIRAATVDDVPRIVELVREFIRTTQYLEVLAEATPERIAAVTLHVINGAGVVYLAEHSETIPAWNPEAPFEAGMICAAEPFTVRHVVGFIAIAEAEHPLTGLRLAEELAWFVTPAHRQGRTAYYLLRHAEEWTRQKGLHMLKMVAPSNSDVGRFYQRVGYAPLETAYIKHF